MKTNGHRRPEEIEADIERTRHELDATLSAIERRFSPGELLDQGMEYLRHNGVREYASNLARAAQRDPLPLALVGVGLAWLMASSRRTSADVPLDEPTLGDKLSATSQRLAQTTQAARERAGRLGASARSGAERLRGGYRRIADEQPLAIGAIGLALGAVLGAIGSRDDDARAADDGERGLPADATPDERVQTASPGAGEAPAASVAGGPQGTGVGDEGYGGRVSGRTAQPDVVPYLPATPR